MGETRAFFQSFGKTPWLNDKLQIVAKKGTVASSESFSNFTEMLSGPAVLSKLFERLQDQSQ